MLKSVSFFARGTGVPDFSPGETGSAETALAFPLAQCQMQLRLSKLLTYVSQESWWFFH